MKKKCSQMSFESLRPKDVTIKSYGIKDSETSIRLEFVTLPSRREGPINWCDLSLFQLSLLGQEGGSNLKDARCHSFSRFFVMNSPLSKINMMMMDWTETLSLVSRHLNFWVMPNICLRYAWKMLKRFPKYCLINIREICLRYFKDLLYLCPLYGLDKADKCLIYPWDMPRISLWYAWDKMFWTKWDIKFHFLWDILKLHTKLNNFCNRSFLIRWLFLKVTKWMLWDQMTAYLWLFMKHSQIAHQS